MFENPTTIKRKKLLFRAWHRGTREADLLLGRYAEAHLPDMDAEQLDLFAQLMDEQDPDIYDWLTGAKDVPPQFSNIIMQTLKDFYGQTGWQIDHPSDHSADKAAEQK
ncbi:MAG TPA: succinate dehydrogenase assembly factor 2 [Alphaproteobacteria bacterium]